MLAVPDPAVLILLAKNCGGPLVTGQGFPPACAGSKGQI